MSDLPEVGAPMSGDRTHLIADAVASRDGQGSPFGRLKIICQVAVELCALDGGGVMLMAERVHQGTAYTTDEKSEQLEHLQNSTGEGPCIQAYMLGRPVFASDLANEENTSWPSLAAGALEAGMGAIFGFPLQLDDTCIGALDLYRAEPGALTTRQAHDGRLLAAMATRSVLAMQEQAEPGSLPEAVEDISGDRASIEQAAGVTAAALGVSVTEAAARLRAHSHKIGQSLPELAAEVVAGRTHVP